MREPWRYVSPHAEFAENVPTDLILAFRQHDRGVGRNNIHDRAYSPEKWTAFKRDIQENGFNEPVVLHFNPHNGYATVQEGNHRIRAAKELGLPHVPVRCVKNSLLEPRNSPSPFFHDCQPVPGHVPGSLVHESGYCPTDLKPSQVFTAHAHLMLP